MNAANAGKIGFQKEQRFLPTRAGEVANSVETTIHRIEMLMPRRPDIAQPLIFFRSDGQNFTNMFVFQIEGRYSLQCFGKLQAHMIDVIELFRHGEQRSQHDSHGLFNAVTLIDHRICLSINSQTIGNPCQGSVTDSLCSLANAVIKSCSKQPDRFSRTQHKSLTTHLRRKSIIIVRCGTHATESENSAWCKFITNRVIDTHRQELSIGF